MNTIMKSKSFDLKQLSEKSKANKSYDFTGLYKSESESKQILSERRKSVENTDKENNNNSPKVVQTPKLDRLPTKNKKKSKNLPLDVSAVNIDGEVLDSAQGTSTPYANSKDKSQAPVKSIMKTTSTRNETINDTPDTSGSKRKKRNKSVSFRLEDNEEVVVKRTKSENSLIANNDVNSTTKTKPGKFEQRKNKDKSIKLKAKGDTEKENKTDNSMEIDENKLSKRKDKTKQNFVEPVLNGDTEMEMPVTLLENNVKSNNKKKKFKKFNKSKKSESSSEIQLDVNIEENQTSSKDEKVIEKENKTKKNKRQQSKQRQTSETEIEEPKNKKKKDVQPEIIASDLENLSIGDNAHTLTNLLDEMTVVDKNKKKKTKRKQKKDVKNDSNAANTETADENTEGDVEKVKWKKRKWNKDKKDGEEVLKNSVIVEGLPLSIMINYKKLLAEHFHSCGVIKGIGIAEVYPTEESKPVFTTTIHFENEDAADKALVHDNKIFRGNRIYIKKPLPATETTVVVRSYGDLTEQTLSSALLGAGKIRNIRHRVKGKKSMATAFIEFDGPEAVERALSLGENVRIGGKKIHISKFELRTKKHTGKKPKSAESENEGDSEDND